MAIQHRLIPDAELHEPKGVASATNKSVYLSDGAGSGSWRAITEAEVNYAVKANNRFGWNDISDSLYTSGSPKAITAATRTQLTNNSLGTATDTTRLGSIWNPSTNVFLINDLNAAYELKVQFKATAVAAVADAYFLKFEMESASGPTVFSAQTAVLQNNSAVNSVMFTVPFSIPSSINNVNTTLYVTPNTDISVYDISFWIRRLYKES